jgi:hypothetical protein
MTAERRSSTPAMRERNRAIACRTRSAISGRGRLQGLLRKVFQARGLHPDEPAKVLAAVGESQPQRAVRQQPIYSPTV